MKLVAFLGIIVVSSIAVGGLLLCSLKLLAKFADGQTLEYDSTLTPTYSAYR